MTNFIVMQESKRMRVSIIFINEESEDWNTLQCAFQGVIRQQEFGDEVILIQNSNTVKLKDKDLTVFHKRYEYDSEVTTLSETMNHVVGAVQNEWIIFVDSKMILDADGISAIKQQMVDSQMVGLTSFNGTYSYQLSQWNILCHVRDIRKIITDLDYHLEFLSYLLKGNCATALENASEFAWMHFNTNFSAIRKTAFVESQGLCSTISNRTICEVEMGIRLQKVGKIEVIKEELYGIKISNKNYLSEMKDRVASTRALLEQDQEPLLEIYSVFDYGLDHAKYQWMVDTIAGYKKMRSDEQETSHITLERGQIYIGQASNQSFQNNILYCLEERKGLKLLGIALPFEDKTFHEAYISKSYTYLPCSILALVIHESLRVADHVYLAKDFSKQMQCNKELFPTIPFIMHFGVFAKTIKTHYYDFIDHNDEFYEVKWKKNAFLKRSREQQSERLSMLSMASH